MGQTSIICVAAIVLAAVFVVSTASASVVSTIPVIVVVAGDDEAVGLLRLVGVDVAEGTSDLIVVPDLFAVCIASFCAAIVKYLNCFEVLVRYLIKGL